MNPTQPARAWHQRTPDRWAEAPRDAGTMTWNTMPMPFQWLTTCAAFADSGGLVSGDELAQRLVDSAVDAGGADRLQAASLVARWVVSRSVVTVLGPRSWMLPLFQFDPVTATPRPSMAPVLNELRGVFDEAELALWFVSSNDWLRGDQPSTIMNKNLPAVLRAARADRFLARGY